MKNGMEKLNQLGSGAKVISNGVNLAKSTKSSFNAGKDFFNSFKTGSGKQKTTNILNAGAKFANSLSNTVSSASDFIDVGAKFANNLGKVANLGNKLDKVTGGALKLVPVLGTVSKGLKAASSTATAASNIMNGKGANIEDSTILKVVDSVGGIFGKDDEFRNWVSNTKSGQIVSNVIAAGEDIAEIIPVVSTVTDIADTAVDAVNFVTSGDAAKAVKNGVKMVKNTVSNAKQAVKTTLTNVRTGAKKTLQKADKTINKGIRKISKVSATTGAAMKGAYNQAKITAKTALNVGKGIYGAQKAALKTGAKLAQNAFKTGSTVLKNSGKTLVKVGKTAAKTASSVIKNNVKVITKGGKIVTKTIGSAGKSLQNGDIVGAGKTIVKGGKQLAATAIKGTKQNIKLIKVGVK